MKNNDVAGIETLMATLIFSLVFSSVVISFLLLNTYGYAATGAESELSIISNENILGLQDYTTNTISNNANYIQTGTGAGTYVYIPGIGRELQNNNFGLEPKLMLRGVQSLNGTYTITYKINNTVHADFTIYARYNGALAYLNIPIKITTDKVEILDFHEFTAAQSVDLLGANTNNHVTIKTQFNEPAGILDVYYDDVLIMSRSGYTGEGNDFYAGVMSKQNGFIIESINAGSIDLNSNTDIFSQASNFLEVLALIIVWNVNPVFLPWEFNLIFIKTQVTGLIICIFVWLRG
jgi:hypothetical protein